MDINLLTLVHSELLLVEPQLVIKWNLLVLYLWKRFKEIAEQLNKMSWNLSNVHNSVSQEIWAEAHTVP